MQDESDSVIKDGIYARLERCGLPISEDKLGMSDLLKNASLLRALAMVQQHSRAKADLLRTHDLTNAESINKALKLQGEANGLLQAVDCIIEIAFTDNNQ